MNKVTIENIKRQEIKSGSVIILNASIDMDKIYSSRRIVIATNDGNLIDLETGYNVTSKFTNVINDKLSFSEIYSILQPFIVEIVNSSDIVIKSKEYKDA